MEQMSVLKPDLIFDNVGKWALQARVVPLK
jgi:hypothetical protein